LAKVEAYLNKVGTSERTKAVIEPRLSDQWFLKMEDLVKPAIKAVLEDGEVKLHPKRFDNTYAHWLNNIRDWNISRQLWWGQQILLISTEMAKRILWLLKVSKQH
jgi:valyl-tRNA synthetase